MRKLAPGRLVIASHNQGKVREIRALLAPYGIEPVSAGDLGLPEPEETGLSFADNALLKARASAEGSGLVALADDSGLCVTALGGAPGVYTADWVKEVDVSDVEPTAHAVPLVNVTRPDEVRPSISNEDALRNAPARSNGLFVVPKIVE